MWELSRFCCAVGLNCFELFADFEAAPFTFYITLHHLHKSLASEEASKIRSRFAFSGLCAYNGHFYATP